MSIPTVTDHISAAAHVAKSEDMSESLQEPSTRQAVGLRLDPSLPWLILHQGVVCKYIRQAVLCAVPNVQPWFVGVHSEEGALAPVFDLTQWSGAAGTGARGQASVALISSASLQMGLLCPEAPVILGVTVNRLDQKMPKTVPEQLRPYVSEALDTDLGLGVAFDPLLWLRQVASTINRHI